MEELEKYLMQFHSFINENYPRFGKPLKLKVEEMEGGNYLVSNGKVYERNEIGENVLAELIPYEEGIISVSEEEISMTIPIRENIELLLVRNFEGRESYFLQRRSYLEDIFKGKVMWDGEGFLYLNSESKKVANYLNRMKAGLPYTAIFDFDNRELIIKKKIDDDLEKEIEEFDTSKYEEFLEKLFNREGLSSP